MQKKKTIRPKAALKQKHFTFIKGWSHHKVFYRHLWTYWGALPSLPGLTGSDENCLHMKDNFR